MNVLLFLTSHVHTYAVSFQGKATDTRIITRSIGTLSQEPDLFWPDRWSPPKDRQVKDDRRPPVTLRFSYAAIHDLGAGGDEDCSWVCSPKLRYGDGERA